MLSVKVMGFSTLRWILFITVLVQLFPAVGSAFCYICTSKEKKTCGYTFMMTEKDEAYVKWCATSCYKLSTRRGDQEVISRGCLPDMKTIEWCRHDRKRDVKGVMCTCNTNLCNSSSSFRSHLHLHALNFFILLCFMYTDLSNK